MRYSIPALSPTDAKLLFKYFLGIDMALSMRFALGFLPDEEHLTSLLCELLDQKGAALHSLPYSIDQLNEDFSKSGSLLRASIQLQTTQYNKYQERHYTQADLGIVVDCKDHVDSALSFRKGVLLQAKRLFPLTGTEYRLSSQYKSFDHEQHQRIEALRNYYKEQSSNHSDKKDKRMRDMDKSICDDGFRYLLYNPPFHILPSRELEIVLHQQISRDAEQIFDWLPGLHLYDMFKQDEGAHALIQASTLLVRFDDVHRLAKRNGSEINTVETYGPFNLTSVVDQINIRENALPWYIVFQLMLGDSGCKLQEFVELVSGSFTNIAHELKILPPRFTLLLSLSVGTNSNQIDEKRKS